VYGATGSTNLALVGAQLSLGGLSLMARLGLGLLVIGFSFKVAAVPFHMWAPDVYDGAPTPVTGFMATAVKTAAFVALGRIMITCFQSAVPDWRPLIWGIAAATMIVGNLIALVQGSLKRMLAYSSVAHAGYLMAAIWPGNGLGVAALLLYLFGYGLTTLAAFAILGVLGRDGEREVTLNDVAGLAGQRPWMAFALAICMLSLLGFPGTIGFIGKWLILSSLVAEHQVMLPVILVVGSVVSAGYYLPVIMAMYMRSARAPRSFWDNGLALTARAVVTVAVVLILLLGVWPTPVLQGAQGGAESLVQSAGTLSAER
jgi:NADH-quinone oxidoreductase subunit N